MTEKKYYIQYLFKTVHELQNLSWKLNLLGTVPEGWKRKEWFDLVIILNKKMNYVMKSLFFLIKLRGSNLDENVGQIFIPKTFYLNWNLRFLFVWWNRFK